MRPRVEGALLTQVSTAVHLQVKTPPPPEVGVTGSKVEQGVHEEDRKGIPSVPPTTYQPPLNTLPSLAASSLLSAGSNAAGLLGVMSLIRNACPPGQINSSRLLVWLVKKTRREENRALSGCADKIPLTHRRCATLLRSSPVIKATNRLSAAAFNTPQERPAALAPGKATRQGHQHQKEGHEHLCVTIPTIPAIGATGMREAENALTI
ncbi:hypothetical protein SKAU_G00028860 [Synaphobranchus kaupii]|uniref:Uncharacterized protein n=1 Tax=Synaphobranchus kaupii TaxID=118154 RepID=A0A9Q1JDW3_SYNKA|nr:hypothetical protein SKAU_G00028860 [Synaphobranchus kaupii]